MREINSGDLLLVNEIDIYTYRTDGTAILMRNRNREKNFWSNWDFFFFGVDSFLFKDCMYL